MENMYPQYWEVLGDRHYLKHVLNIEKHHKQDHPGFRKEQPVPRQVTHVRENASTVDSSPDEHVEVVPKEGLVCGVENCDSKGLYECGDCRSLYYCSRDHQEKHWDKHKRKCRLYDIRLGSDSFGVAVARNHVGEEAMGAVILDEGPLVVLPQIPPKGDFLVCISCCRPISWEENVARCRKCNWPVCDVECDSEESLHSEEECRILAPVRDSCHWTKKGGFESLWMLRILSLKKANPLAYHKVQEIQVPVDRLTMEDVVPHQYFALQTVRKMYDIKPDEFSDEEVNHVWNVLRLKYFVSLHSMSTFFRRAKVLYSEGSFFPHSCHPNAAYEMTQDFRLKVSLQRPVRANDQITLNYDSEAVFQPTRSRQLRLKQLFKMICSCPRCEDPTEFGTYFGGIPCHATPACLSDQSRGYLLPTNPKDPGSPWKCSSCPSVSICNSEVQSWLHSIQNGVESIFRKQEPLQLCFFVEKMCEQQILHDCHHLVFEYFVEALKLFHKELEVDPEKRNIPALLKYRRAAGCVTKIFRSFLPKHTNLIGSIPQLCALIKIAVLVDSFDRGVVHVSKVVQDLERFVLATEKGSVVVKQRGALAMASQGKLRTMVCEMMSSLIAHIDNYMENFDIQEGSSSDYVTIRRLKCYVDILRENFCANASLPPVHSSTASTSKDSVNVTVAKDFGHSEDEIVQVCSAMSLEG